MTRERDHEPDVAADFDDGLQRLDSLLARLYGPLGGDLPPADLEPGACAECGYEARRRWRYGPLALCRTCTRRHVRAAAQVDVESPLGDPVEELAERARAAIAEHSRGVGEAAVTGSAFLAEGEPVRPASTDKPQETRRFVP